MGTKLDGCLLEKDATNHRQFEPLLQLCVLQVFEKLSSGLERVKAHIYSSGPRALRTVVVQAGEEGDPLVSFK